MIAAVADRADTSKADAKRALDALDQIVLRSPFSVPLAAPTGIDAVVG
jgi:hypothetical protein